MSKVYSQKSDTSLLLKKKTFILKDTANDCTIITSSRSVYKDVNMFGLKDSTVRFLKDDLTGKLMINDIRTIKFKGTGFWRGALIGYGIGFVSGFIIGCYDLGFSNEFKFGDGFAVGFLIGIPFALVGGGLGSLFAEDKLYDMGNMNLEAKRKKIMYLMKEYPDR